MHAGTGNGHAYRDQVEVCGDGWGSTWDSLAFMVSAPNIEGEQYFMQFPGNGVGSGVMDGWEGS